MYSQVFKGQSLCSLIDCMSAGYRLNSELDAVFDYRRFPRLLEARFPALRLDGLVCGRPTALGEIIAPASHCQIASLPVDLGEDLWSQSLPRLQSVAVQEPAPPRAISRRWARGAIVTTGGVEQPR